MVPPCFRLILVNFMGIKVWKTDIKGLKRDFCPGVKASHWSDGLSPLSLLETSVSCPHISRPSFTGPLSSYLHNTTKENEYKILFIVEANRSSCRESVKYKRGQEREEMKMVHKWFSYAPVVGKAELTHFEFYNRGHMLTNHCSRSWKSLRETSQNETITLWKTWVIVQTHQS